MIDWPALQERTNTAALAAFGAIITLDGVPMQGDFCAPGDQVFLDGVSAMATRPQVAVASADVPDAPVGRPCFAGGQSWRVADARPDGFGLTVLYLEQPL
jgi:hypothetical protein